MKLIDISTPKYPNTFAMVDDEDYERINAHKWSACESSRGQYYARRNKSIGPGLWLIVYMHREIVGARPGQMIDHRDGNRLNNTRANIRIATTAENSMNSRKQRRQCYSKYKGVTLNNRHNKWVAGIFMKEKRIHLGTFKTEVEAAKAYNVAATALFGEFAKLNEI